MMQNSLPSATPDMFATESTEAVPVLREIFVLLQDYAPTWFSEELYNRIASAVGEMVLEPVS